MFSTGTNTHTKEEETYKNVIATKQNYHKKQTTKTSSLHRYNTVKHVNTELIKNSNNQDPFPPHLPNWLISLEFSRWSW